MSTYYQGKSAPKGLARSAIVSTHLPAKAIKKVHLLLLDLFPQLITTSVPFRFRFDSLPVSRLRGRYIEG